MHLDYRACYLPNPNSSSFSAKLSFLSVAYGWARAFFHLKLRRFGYGPDIRSTERDVKCGLAYLIDGKSRHGAHAPNLIYNPESLAHL